MLRIVALLRSSCSCEVQSKHFAKQCALPRLGAAATAGLPRPVSLLKSRLLTAQEPSEEPRAATTFGQGPAHR
jgi:hypothetical protein